MATNDFLPFATGAGANVLAQSDYAALPAVASGYQSGVAKSQQLNKTWRQSSIMAAVLAQFIADQSGQNSVDDGTTATLLSNLKASIKALTNGKLLNVQTFTSNSTYTPVAGVKFVIVEVVGAGGSGGGCAATGASQISVGSGGGAGAYAKALITSNFAGVAVTVGVGGAPAAGFASNPGTASSFGSLVSCPGGLGGTSAGPTTPPWFTGVNTSAAPTGGNVTGAAGASGGISVALSSTAGYGAAGGSSPFGGGGGPAVINSAGLPSPTQGAGGGGSMIGPSQAAIAGGRGGNGVVIVYEFGAAS